MLTLEEIVELKEKLAKGEITPDRAKKIYWDNYEKGKRSWHTKDWKERRKEFIKNKCEICGSIETLTLQHLSHPKKYHKYENEVTRKYNRLFMDRHPSIGKQKFIEHVRKNFRYVPAPMCPECNKRYPNKRTRKKPQYLCTECRLEFEKPVYKTIEELIELFYIDKDVTEVRDKCFITTDKWKNKQNLKQVKYWLQRENAKTKYSDKIEKEAFLLYLNDNIKYLSFEETITACKKCAFNFDLNNIELCPKCKKYYKGIPYPTCINCLPENKRKRAFETIEFGKEMRAMHEKLGI